jgi:hypothetical protein
MKIFIYQTNQDVPIKGFYQSLGGSLKTVIFSNVEKHFDEKTVEMLLKDIALDDETAIFYVPSKMKDRFKKRVEGQFQGTTCDEIKLTPEEENASKRELLKSFGLGLDELTRFVKEKMEIIGVMKPKKACPKECADLLESIVSDDNNPIDAIFVYVLKNKVMLCQTENSAKPGTLQKYKLKSIVKSLGSLKNDGLKCDILEFDDGIVISYVVKNASLPEAIVGFITTVNKNMGSFLLFCNNHFDNVKGKCGSY